MTDKKAKAIEDFDDANTVPFGIALGIPKYTDEVSETTVYKINVVEQRKRREREQIIDTNDDYEEEK